MFLIVYIVIGLLLGPTSLNLPTNDTVVNTAACGFLFMAGLEVRLRALKKTFRKSLPLALGAFLIPFLAGWVIWPGQYVLAIALSISALPVIVQILKDLKIYNSLMANTILGSATLCDLAAWALFIFLLPHENRQSWLLSHGAVGFFFLGLILSDVLRLPERAKYFLMKLSQWVFAPIFFIGVGMKIHIQDSFDLGQFALIMAVACMSKVLGTYAVARWISFSHTHSLLAATVLNARGAMEILYATIALQAGMIDRTLFTSLILMAVLSSVIAAPIARRWRSDLQLGPRSEYPAGS